jgi:uncharacterized beta-barrel protein YwiB (DUF1934 family)
MAQQTHTPVKIELKTTVWQDGEQETFELVLFGRYYKKEDAIYLQYEEVQEEGTIHSVVKVKEFEAVILRKGAVNMRMSFSKKEEMPGSYESPFGTMLLTTKTDVLSWEQNEEDTLEGAIRLKYHLHSHGSYVGTYDLSITYKEAKSSK